MEKRKENARYLNQCFTMMVLLNCIIVLFLAFTIVLTQYRVAAAQEAQQFIVDHLDAILENSRRVKETSC